MGQAATQQPPPRELNLRERIEALETRLLNIDKAHSEQLNTLAEKIIQLQNQVG